MPPVLMTYLAISCIAGPIWKVAQLRRIVSKKEDLARAGERWGKASIPRGHGPLVWFHAASVGESRSILGLISALLAVNTKAQVLITTGTVTSARMLEAELPARAIHQFVPYDTPKAVRAFLKHWKPDVAVWAESELWPRMLRESHAAGIPMLLINARISEKSTARWQKWPKTAAALLRSFDSILAQDRTTAAFIENLDIGKVQLSGSMKQEKQPPDADPRNLHELKQAIGMRDAWLAASTHPGEEEFAAKAHFLANEALMILAPRHPERGNDLAAQLRADGFIVAQRSLGEPLSNETQIYLADTIGEMGLWYRLANRCFVGGSLTAKGGHNPFEPAALECAILSGPHVFNFREPYQALSEVAGYLTVKTAEDLARGLTILRSDTRRTMQTAAAKDCLNRQNGSTQMALSEIMARLEVKTKWISAPGCDLGILK